MQQTSLEKQIAPRFTLRTSLGFLSRRAQAKFNKALAHYKQQSGELQMLQPDKSTIANMPGDISDYATMQVPAMKLPEQKEVLAVKLIEQKVTPAPEPPAPTLLKFSSDYPPILAMEAAIHHHLDKCRALPAALYVDSQTFLPRLAEQYQRVKFAELNGGFLYFTGHHVVRIPVLTEHTLDEWARASLGGVIPANMIISAISL